MNGTVILKLAHYRTGRLMSLGFFIVGTTNATFYPLQDHNNCMPFSRTYSNCSTITRQNYSLHWRPHKYVPRFSEKDRLYAKLILHHTWSQPHAWETQVWSLHKGQQRDWNPTEGDGSTRYHHHTGRPYTFVEFTYIFMQGYWDPNSMPGPKRS